MMNWMPPEERLSSEQDHVRRQCQMHGQHSVIRGFPGTGKTVVLVWVALDLVEQREQVCVATYTRSLRTLIETAFKGVDRRPPVITHKKLLKDQRRYDSILLDEVQDISADDLKAIANLSDRLVMAGDPFQRIYDRDDGFPGEFFRTTLKPQEHHLTVLFRLPQPLRDVANAILPEARLDTAIIDRSARVRPVLMQADSEEQERRWLWQQMKDYAPQAGELGAVVFPKHEDVKGFLRWLLRLHDRAEPEFPLNEFGDRPDYRPANRALANAGLPVQYFGNGYGSLGTQQRYCVMTYHSAKGLDFETVFMPALTTTNRIHGKEALERRRLYVAITRSRKNLFISYSGDAPNRHVGRVPESLLPREKCSERENLSSTGQRSEAEDWF